MLNYKLVTTISIWVIFALVYTPAVLYAQHKQLRGAYVDASPLNSISYKFSGNKFEKVEFVHDYKIVSKGYHLIAGDTLIFIYNKLKDPTPSIYRFIQKDTIANMRGEQNKEKMLLTLVITDDHERRIPGAIVRLYDTKQEQYRMSFVSDSLGSVPDLWFESPFVDKVMVSMIGYKPLHLALDSLWGYHSKIQVMLNDSKINYAQEEKIEKFIIGELSNSRLVLKTIDGKGKEVLKKKG